MLIPANAQTGSLLGMRIRLSLSEITSPYGFLPNGEVEDYMLGLDCSGICLPIGFELKKK